MVFNQWWREETPEEEWAVYESFRVFLRLAWGQLELPEPTPVQLDMADYLQYGPRRSVIEAFRGVGKSWITAAFVCWLLFRDAQLNILVVSASKERADNFTTFTLRMIQDWELLQHLAPLPHQRQSKVGFDVSTANPDQAPSVRSVGVMGQMTGGRADFIIPDDVEVPNNSETQAMRDKLADRVKEFDAILKPGGSIKYLGTPQTEESLYNKLPERGYDIRVWPSQFPVKAVYLDETLAPFIREMMKDPKNVVPLWNGLGAPTDPRRFDAEDLMEREASYGRSGYALQFMLDTRLSDADRYPLRLEDLIVMDLNPDVGPEKVMWARGPTQVADELPTIGMGGDRYYHPFEYARDPHGAIKMHAYKGSILVIDPAGRGKDETAIVVLKMLNSQIFLTKLWATRDGYSEDTLIKIAELAKEQQVNMILIESNFGDGMFEALLIPYLKRIYRCTTEEVRATGMKEKRLIDTLEPVMNQHRLIVDTKAIEWDYQSTQALPPEQQRAYRLFHQMTRLTKDKGALAHDDRLDALATGVAYWVEQMGVDQDEAIQANLDEALQKELDSFMDDRTGSLVNMGHNGRPPLNDTWV